MAARWVVPLSDVLVDDELRDALDEVIRSGWWSMGPRVSEFEEAFAASCETRHAIAVANGTAALHIALLAVGCGPGDEVVLPSLNFVAAANTVVHTGARPVFCDIVGPADLNLDPNDLEAAITDRTKAIVALHYAGTPCDMDRVSDIAERRGLVVIEDAAHAPAARWRGRPCGSLGSIGCFSFFSNKNLPVGEGGMIVTDDDDFAGTIRLLRSHGMTTLTWDRHRGHANEYDVVAHGFNYRLDELRAALGLVQLRRLEDGNEQRRQHLDRYRDAFASVPEIHVPAPVLPEGSTTSAHIASVVLAESVDRAALRQNLTARGIQTSVHYPPIHRFERFRELSNRRLSQTEAVSTRLLTLPLYPHMGEESVGLVTSAVLDAIVVSEAA